MVSNATEVITRDALVRAIQATRRSLPERATGAEALEGLAAEIVEPHSCHASYRFSDGGPCETCGEWVNP